ncbi:MAG: hypothetical protein LBB87_04795, partial [Nitrososphaerota archaeon]|nr:hypothetical protein [Nitrososphaerota archaeon]
MVRFRFGGFSKAGFSIRAQGSILPICKKAQTQFNKYGFIDTKTLYRSYSSKPDRYTTKKLSICFRDSSSVGASPTVYY